VPEQNPVSKRWNLSIFIRWERDGAATVRPFSATKTFQTEEEADLHGIGYGQRIIEGEVPGFSVGYGRACCRRGSDCQLPSGRAVLKYAPAIRDTLPSLDKRGGAHQDLASLIPHQLFGRSLDSSERPE